MQVPVRGWIMGWRMHSDARLIVTWGEGLLDGAMKRLRKRNAGEAERRYERL